MADELLCINLVTADEGCSLKLSFLVLEHSDPNWVQPLTAEDVAYFLLLSIEPKVTDENSSLIGSRTWS
jgi:hypothetical protein